MSEWWTYRPEDFLLFSPRVYWRMFELHNAQFWPLHLLMFAAGFAVLLLVPRVRAFGPWTAAILALLWIFVGWSFLWSRYAVINWVIVYLAPVFGGQALLLVFAAASGKFAFDRIDTAGRAGLLLAGLGLVIYPLLAAIFARPWSSAEVFGIAPDPTAITTLGILLAASGRFPLLLFPVPLAWLLLSGVTLRTMGEGQGWIPLLAVGTTIVLLGLRSLARR